MAPPATGSDADIEDYELEYAEKQAQTERVCMPLPSATSCSPLANARTARTATIMNMIC
eukprot:m.147574 g.147574  ORF g.147574 m.147574 type:complete len:59 (+) comp16117_c4_seq2:189-365(+)